MYKEYKIGDIVTIHEDNWYVIDDSDSKEDYVKLINLNYNRTINDCSRKYDNINEKKYFEGEYASSLGVSLKEVDGYKVRLISLEEYENLATLTKKDLNDKVYKYTTKLKHDWVKDINTLSMTDVYYHYEVEGSCVSWYIQSSMREVLGNKNGFVNIQPVINLNKEEI